MDERIESTARDVVRCIPMYTDGLHTVSHTNTNPILR